MSGIVYEQQNNGRFGLSFNLNPFAFLSKCSRPLPRSIIESPLYGACMCTIDTNRHLAQSIIVDIPVRNHRKRENGDIEQWGTDLDEANLLAWCMSASPLSASTV